MLLAIDIGNSNISVGLFSKERKLHFLASIDTDSRKTSDQISIDLMNIFSLYGFRLKDVSGAIFSSVVPPMNFMMEKALTRLLGKPPMIVGPGVKTGLNIRMEIHTSWVPIWWRTRWRRWKNIPYPLLSSTWERPPPSPISPPSTPTRAA